MKARRQPGTPTLTLEDADRVLCPRVTLPADLPGWTFNQDGMTMDACTVPAGAVLVDFHRDVALAWYARHGDGYPCNVLWPDGRYLYMTVDTERLLKVVLEQAPMDWSAERQCYEPRAE